MTFPVPYPAGAPTSPRGRRPAGEPAVFLEAAQLTVAIWWPVPRAKLGRRVMTALARHHGHQVSAVRFDRRRSAADRSAGGASPTGRSGEGPTAGFSSWPQPSYGKRSSTDICPLSLCRWRLDNSSGSGTTC